MKPRLSYAEAFPGKVSASVETAHRASSLLSPDVRAWRPPRGSADALLLPELTNLVERSRDIDRNNGVAKGAKSTILDNVVGTGLRLSSRPDWKALGQSQEWAEDWARQYETLWSEWWYTTACDAADTYTGDQLTYLNYGTEISSGEFLALPLWIPERRDGFSTKFQLIDPDRLSQPDGGVAQSARFRGGIEFDQYGGRVAAHIRRTHPSDLWVDPSQGYGWERIPWRTPFGRLRVIHGFCPERTGQSRGKPMLSAILPQFKQLDRYTNAEIMAAVVNAMVALVIEAPMSHEQVMDLFEKSENPAQDYVKLRQEHAVELAAGRALSLFPGDKVSSFLPSRPATGFGAFTENVLRIAGVGLDLPYELVLKDFSKTNYSSARAALLEAWRSFRRRRDWLATQWYDPTSWLFLEEMVNAGRIEAPDFYAKRWAYQRCKWVGNGRGWIDPLKEAQAAQTRVTLGISTLEDECAEQGSDWQEVMDQRAREIEYAKKLGIYVEPKPPAPPGAPSADNEEREDPPRRSPSSEAAAL